MRTEKLVSGHSPSLGMEEWGDCTGMLVPEPLASRKASPLTQLKSPLPGDLVQDLQKPHCPVWAPEQRDCHGRHAYQGGTMLGTFTSRGPGMARMEKEVESLEIHHEPALPNLLPNLGLRPWPLSRSEIALRH